MVRRRTFTAVFKARMATEVLRGVGTAPRSRSQRGTSCILTN